MEVPLLRRDQPWPRHGEGNPGRFTTPPAGTPKVHNGATQPVTAKVAATTIKGVAKSPAVKPPEKPESAQPAAESKPPASKARPKPSAPSSPPPAAKKGVLEQIASRVYG